MEYELGIVQLYVLLFLNLGVARKLSLSRVRVGVAEDETQNEKRQDKEDVQS